ncbi:MAG: penicillin-binding protein [Eggerthellaceae bacterium]|nr:penicillin-binding protein [Eggerthellaceae bacterium]
MSRALKQRQGTRNKRRYLPLIFIAAVLATLAVGMFTSAYALGESWLQDLPDYEDSSAYNLAQKTRVYASDGSTLLAEFYLEDREPRQSLDQISDWVIKGTVDTEDERFYEHNGIDLPGIARALVVNLSGGALEGASTITQQFVRNTVLAGEAQETTYKRKLREMYIALKLEESYSKDDILLLYLNTINYGSGAYGIEAAAKRYFSVGSKDLTLAQAATLVGIPQSPLYNNPIDYPDTCLERRNLVLNRMLTNGDITSDEYNAALAEPLGLNVSEHETQGIYAYPYFTSYVRQWLLDNYSESEVFKGGMRVTTTLDVGLQGIAENAARQKESEVDEDMECAMVVIDPSNGFVRALVGGKDYYADQFNLATQATRSPGSSFKTYTLVAAIENGINPATSVNCASPITIDNWRVENYDGASYSTQAISSAFAISSNTGFARLSTLITPAKVAEMARRLGVETPLMGYQSITLGAEAVTVKDMASAYATIASGGIRHDAVPVIKIEDVNGNTIFEPDTTGTRVISPEVANAAETVMEGVVNNGTGTEANPWNGTIIAGKTGTSEDWHDSYFVGITPQYSVAIWLGTREERRLNAAYTAAGAFRYFIVPALEGQEIIDFPMAGASAPVYRTLTSAEVATLTSGFGAPVPYVAPEKKDDEEKKEEQSSSKPDVAPIDNETPDVNEEKKKQEEEAAKKAAEEEAAKKAAEEAAAAEAAKKAEEEAAQKAAEEAARKAAEEAAAQEAANQAAQENKTE